MDRRKTVAVVEDDQAVRRSVTALLETWGYAIDAYCDAETFLDRADPESADCVLLDVRLPGRDGLSLVAELRGRGEEMPIVIITGHGDIDMAVAALKAGAQDFLEKPFDGDDLVRRIGAAIASSQKAAQTREDHAALFDCLTPRETQVMEEVVAGHPNKVIAHHLGLSPKTVEIHRARVMQKTGATSLSHLVRLALKAGIDPDAGPAPK